jgi:hypothetical protein
MRFYAQKIGIYKSLPTFGLEENAANSVLNEIHNLTNYVS